MSRIAAAAIAVSEGFAVDRRFSAGPRAKAPALEPLPVEDPLEVAWAEGFAAGATTAEAEAQALAEETAAASARIELAFARLDVAQEEALRQRLHETVTALCEAAIAPLALDADALTRRVVRAATMLARADDERVLRLHPDDLALLSGRLPDGLPVEPDPMLDRGALRVETQSGGIEDGPGHWHRAIAEALAQC